MTIEKWSGVALAAVFLAVPLREAAALDLPTALREVASANPTLAARREMVEAARRRSGTAGAWQSPMVEVGVLNVPTSGGFDMDPMTMKMVGIEQRLPIFGANRLSGRSAGAAAEAEAAGLEMASFELFAMTWEAYADAYYADRLAHMSRHHRGEMGQLVQSARARYDSGRGRLDDVLRAEAEQARMFADLAHFEAEAEGARGRLAILMGREAGGVADSLAPPPSFAVADDPRAIASWITESHPRLRQLSAEADRYRLAAGASRRMLWPDLTLAASYGAREPIGGIPQDDMWSATVAFMLPILGGKRDEASEMEAMSRVSESELRAATLELGQQSRSLYASARANARVIALLSDTVLVTQRRAVSASWSAYEAGTTDLWRVFEATHALYAEEVMLARARQELARTEAQLLAVTARGDLFGVTLPEIPRSEP